MLFPDEVKENRDVFKVFIRYTLWTFLVISLLFVYIWQSMIVSDLEYDLKRMKKECALLEKQKKKLETEVSFLGSAERIGRIAEEKLGLVQVKQDNIIWIDCSIDKKELARKE